MKKIIALAVAGAFVAPVYAAEVTVGGEIEYVYTDSDASDANIADNDNLIRVTATEELPNGMTITGKYQVIRDTSASNLENDGTNINLTGPHGNLTVGDTSGALDSTGDYTDVAPSGGGFAMDGPDSTLLYKLPLGVEGLTVAVSHSPDGTNSPGSNDSVKDGENGAAVTYSFGAGAVYYGTSSYPASAGAADDDYNAYGIKYSTSGFYLAYESGEKEPASGTKIEYTGAAVTYSMGDIKIGFESQETQTKGSAASVEDTIMFAEYNLGSNVDVYIAAVDDGTTTNDDSTRVGIEYNF